MNTEAIPGYTAEQLLTMHDETQATCNKALGMACLASEMARSTAAAFKTWQQQASPELIEKVLLVGDIGEWLPNYLKLSELEFAEKFHENRPGIVRKCMELLEIIPSGA